VRGSTTAPFAKLFFITAGIPKVFHQKMDPLLTAPRPYFWTSPDDPVEMEKVYETMFHDDHSYFFNVGLVHAASSYFFLLVFLVFAGDTPK